MSDAPAEHPDVAIVGAGPGGYVAALRAAQLGLRTTIIDAGPMGGTCLNIGCIPSKAIIHAADRYAAVADRSELAHLGITSAPPTLDLGATQVWKQGVVDRLTRGVAGLLKAAGVQRVDGLATVIDGKTLSVDTAAGPQIVRASNLVIATGSRPLELPELAFGGIVVSSTGALALTEVPARLVIVGAGYIGLELGTAFAKLGAAVTVVEMADRILPQYDQAITRPVAARLRGLGVTIHLQSVARGLTPGGDALVVAPVAGGDPVELPADVVLVTVGRTPVLDGWGVETLDLRMNGRYLHVDERCATSMAGVYAIGDVTGEPMLAHRASAQGELVAEVIAGRRRSWDDRVIPEVCFTDPEIISVGLSPERAQAAGSDVAVGTFALAASGRALTLGRTDGFVRVTARRDDGLVLGVQAVGAGVSELSAELALAMEMGATLVDLATTVHAHPTLTEAVREASLLALGRGLHSHG